MDKEIILTVRVDTALKDRIDKAIDRQPLGASVSDLVRRGIELVLKELDKRK